MNNIWIQMTYYHVLSVLPVLSLVWLMMKIYNIGQRDAHLPPGPPTLPVIGNAHLLPRTLLHLKLTEWSKVYGGIYSLKLGPQTAIVLTSPALVKELMDKRSASNPDRPSSYMADVITGGMNIAMARYDKYWRPLRRTVHEILTRNACIEHFPIQLAEATQLMHDILTQPKGFYNHIRRYSTSVITSVLFGTRFPKYESSVMKAFYHSLDLWQLALEPGAQPPVDLVPILRYIPERWASWKTLCRTVRHMQRTLYFGLLAQCERRILEGRPNGCFMERVLEKMDKYSITRELAGYVGGALLEGGSETTSLFLQTLVQVLVVFPDVQKKAHEEIDRVIGSERLPTLADINNLPYMQAIVKENYRYRPVAPLGLPHATLTEEMIDGYVIPPGSIIFMNIWGMSHDEEAFDAPEDFNPDRFLTSEYGTKLDASQAGRRHDLAFGSGRRKCPGIHFAEHSIFINTMNLLWGFNFSEAVDPHTNTPIKLDLKDQVKGVLTGPNPFLCKIEVRSERHAQLIMNEYDRNKSTLLSVYEVESPQPLFSEEH